MKNRILRRMKHGLFLWILAMMMINQEPVSAEDVSGVDLAKQSVYCIQTCLVDDANEGKYLNADYPVLKQGSCFVIGNVQRGQEQYIITAKSNLDVKEKDIVAFRSEHRLKEDASVNARYKIVISEDVIRTATVYDKAGDSNYAILKISDKLPECPGLVIGDVGEEGEGTALFLLSYNLDAHAVDMQSTTMKDVSADRFHYTADMKQNDGAPLVDEEGRLMGMRITNEAAKENAGEEALSVAVLQRTFDMLGIEYDSFDSKQVTLGNRIEETKQLLEDNSYTKKTEEHVTAVLEEAQEIYEDPRATNSAYEEQLTLIDEAVEALKPMHEIYMLIIYILAGVIAVLLIILGIRAVSNRKKEKKIQYRETPQENRSAAAAGKRHRKAHAAADFDGEGTVAMDRTMPTVFLIHKSTGQKLLVSKTIFSIGSKEEMVDYCIKGNATISRRHAALINENGIIFIQDLNSMNHVYVNNIQLEPGAKQVLRNGDAIRLANEEFIFQMK